MADADTMSEFGGSKVAAALRLAELTRAFRDLREPAAPEWDGVEIGLTQEEEDLRQQFEQARKTIYAEILRISATFSTT